MPVADLIRRIGITEQTFYRWKKQYARLNSDQARQLKQLQEENERLKKIVAELSLDKAMLADVIKKVVKAAPRRAIVDYLKKRYTTSERHACRLIGIARRVYSYTSCRDPQTALRLRMKEPATTRMRYGYRKIGVLLRREGFRHSVGVMYRIYREEGLSLRYRPGRRSKAQATRPQRKQASRPDQAWSMDFVADQLANGNRFRCLTIVDVFTRECMAIEVGQRLSGNDVVAVLNRLRQAGRIPGALFCDNG
jgi:putative transposase